MYDKYLCILIGKGCGKISIFWKKKIRNGVKRRRKLDKISSKTSLLYYS